jgi:hypothetical protein
MNKIEICQKVLEEQTAIKITVTSVNKEGKKKNRKVLLDLFTCGKIINIYNKVNNENKIKLTNAPWQVLLNIAYKY